MFCHIVDAGRTLARPLGARRAIWADRTVDRGWIGIEVASLDGAPDLLHDVFGSGDPLLIDMNMVQADRRTAGLGQHCECQSYRLAHCNGLDQLVVEQELGR